MKLIPLTKGYCAMVDDEDFDRISSFRWRANIAKRGIVYAVRQGPRPERSIILMHRMIIGASYNEIVDHDDGNGLNNQKYNLRTASHQQNLGNQSSRRAGLPKGVYKREGKLKTTWKAHCGGKYLGSFANEDDAIAAYNLAALQRWGSFAKTN